jgi:hypothetical protein
MQFLLLERRYYQNESTDHVFFSSNRTLFRVSITFVLSKKYTPFKTLIQSTKVWF